MRRNGTRNRADAHSGGRPAASARRGPARRAAVSKRGVGEAARIHYPRSMALFRASATRTRALLVVLAVVSLVVLFTTRVSRKMPDFQVYRTAGSRALAAAPLYREEDGHYQFKYLPPFAILAAPIALVPLPAAKAGWFAV